LAELGPLIAIIGFTLIFYLVEHKKISINLYNNPLKSSLVGIVGGIIWLGLSVGILMFLRIMKIDGYNSIPMLWLWIISVFINTIMQEMLVRGYIYQMLKAKFDFPAAIFLGLLCHMK
jgi:membrane protease YdiL (CAAX protease family)